MEEDYSTQLLKKSNKELKELCKLHNLPISGNKKEMAQQRRHLDQSYPGKVKHMGDIHGREFLGVRVTRLID